MASPASTAARTTRPRSTPAIRAAGAGRDGAVQRQRESRPLEPLLEPRRDDADDARRPALARHDHASAAFLEPEAGERLRLGLGQHGDLDLLPRPIEPVELVGDLSRAQVVARRQQPGAERGVADPAARVDARADQIAEVIAARRPVGPRRVEQRREAGALAPPHHREPPRHEGPVEADQRHDVRHRRQRHQVERAHQVGRSAAVEEAGFAQRPIEGDEPHVDDPRRAEIAEAGEIVLPVRIDDRRGRGQGFRRLVMIEDDDVEPEPSGLGERLEADRAAIDGHDQARPLRLERRHRLDVRAVALDDAVRNMDQSLAAAGLEVFAEQRRAGRAVDVVVAENRHPLAPLDRSLQPRGRGLHFAHREGVGHQVAQGRIEMALDPLDPDTPASEDPRHQFVLAGDLRDRQRPRLPRRVEPRAPGAAGQGAFDIEEERGHQGRAPWKSRRRRIS